MRRIHTYSIIAEDDLIEEYLLSKGYTITTLRRILKKEFNIGFLEAIECYNFSRGSISLKLAYTEENYKELLLAISNNLRLEYGWPRSERLRLGVIMQFASYTVFNNIFRETCNKIFGI